MSLAVPPPIRKQATVQRILSLNHRIAIVRASTFVADVRYVLAERLIGLVVLQECESPLRMWTRRKLTPTSRADYHGCTDAVFTQKCGDGPLDPAQSHPDTHFLPDDLVNAMEEYVEAVRNSKPKKCARGNAEEEEDGFEHDNLHVPKSVLDGCKKSFTSAEENRAKATTTRFSITAMMGLLCRHDRVLWLVNMRSAGEKQHYVLVLLEMLFQHLPRSASVGLLYDIGCQLHRSCLKHGFLGRYLHRLSFAISILHAFGHQWACQLIYHPRKRIGYGFTDGEGCEHFWHAISKLIALLRVCAVCCARPPELQLH